MILSYINSFINITCGLPCRLPVYIIIIINFESNIKSNRFNNTNQVQSIVVRSITLYSKKRHLLAIMQGQLKKHND